VPPLWAPSAAFVELPAKGGDRKDRGLAVVDANRNRQMLLTYRIDGKKLKLERRLEYLLGTDEVLPPETIQAAADGFWLELRKSTFVRYEADLTLGQSPTRIRLLGRENSWGVELAGIFGWHHLGGSADGSRGVLLAYSDVKRFDYESTFVRIPLDDPRSFDDLGPTIDLADRGRVYYLLNHQYVTGAGDRFYYLVMRGGARPEIYEAGRDGGEPRALTIAPEVAGFRYEPTYPPNDGSLAPRDLYLELRRQELPLGIFGYPAGDPEDLLVLVRRPGEGGGDLRWSMLRFDVGNESGEAKLAGTYDLNGTSAVINTAIDAKELLVVPGSPCWAFIEKRWLTILGKQDTPSVVLVPEAAFSSENTEKNTRSCLDRPQA